jgi:hypothetical protein
LGCHPVAVVKCIYTHKQYTEQHNRHKQYLEQHNRHKQYVEQHSRHKQSVEQQSTQTIHRTTQSTQTILRTTQSTQTIHRTTQSTQTIHRTTQSTQTIHRTTQWTQTIHRTTQSTQTIHRTTQSTQTILRTTQFTNYEECEPCHVFASFILAFALQLRKKHGKTSVRVVGEYKRQYVDAVGCHRLIKKFVFDILQIATGCSRIDSCRLYCIQLHPLGTDLATC